MDTNGRTIVTGREPITVGQAKTATHSTTLTIKNPQIWDIATPNLYTLVSSIEQNGKIIDNYQSTFGIRTIEFTANDGFKLNGKRVPLNGACMHHDLGPLGAAVNYRATERQVEILKTMGVNSIRTSHNPPSTELLDICDRLGVLVQVEAFDEWRKAKVPNGYHKHFDEWHERDLRDMIKRDRNHPSVIMWSIGNEILEQGEADGWKLTKELSDICHDEDPTRPTTAGFNYFPAPFKNKLAYQVDVVGMNYKPYQYKEVKEKHPDMIIYGSETSSQTSSRGIYHLPLDAQPQKETGHVSSYDVIVGPPWAYPPDVEFKVQEEDTFLLGEFIWTGFDYLGEPTPYGGRDNSTNGYWNDDWPSHASYFAPIDLCGLPKDRYYLYQSQWTEKPMVHVLPHWNWEGKEGETIPVFAYTNAAAVELFVNGKSYGKKVKGEDLTSIPAAFRGYKLGTFESPYRLSWEIPYEKGSLKVVAYEKGKVVASKEIKTAGKAAKINLKADRTQLTADGKDLSFITVRIEDENSNLCPRADYDVQFEVEGEGKLEAVCNGNQRSLESFQAANIKAFSGQCVIVVRANKKAGKIRIRAKTVGLEDGVLELS
ncbi:MAG: glycoside hydrolase family 2 TIM barrel-domain containing protein, partial [Bacteroidota bacterium]